MKLALILNVVDPAIGGVLIMGDRGTGKSVAVSVRACCEVVLSPKDRRPQVAEGCAAPQVRALVDLLPDITVVENDPFNSDAEDPSLMGACHSASFRRLDLTERTKLWFKADLSTAVHASRPFSPISESLHVVPPADRAGGEGDEEEGAAYRDHD